MSTYLAVTFIGLLFIFFECLPVFVKLMSSRGPYDRSVENIEQTQIYQSDKEREYETEVTDGVHETHVSTETEKRKEIIKGQAYQDLKNHNWDN
ncbi:hypothetical protein D3C87_1580040 [compost metagenome]